MCVEIPFDQTQMEPLKTLSPRSDHIVVAISKNLELLKVKELQGSLEAHEQRLNQRNTLYIV